MRGTRLTRKQQARPDGQAGQPRSVGLLDAAAAGVLAVQAGERVAWTADDTAMTTATTIQPQLRGPTTW